MVLRARGDCLRYSGCPLMSRADGWFNGKLFAFGGTFGNGWEDREKSEDLQEGFAQTHHSW